MSIPNPFCMTLLEMLLLLLVVAAKLETSAGCTNQPKLRLHQLAPKLEESFQLGADISATILAFATDLKDPNDCDDHYVNFWCYHADLGSKRSIFLEQI